jgi:hypothetical protein
MLVTVTELTGVQTMDILAWQGSGPGTILHLALGRLWREERRRACWGSGQREESTPHTQAKVGGTWGLGRLASRNGQTRRRWWLSACSLEGTVG